MTTTTTPLRMSGIITWISIRHGPQPSIRAASASSAGIVWKIPRMMKTLSASESVT